MENSKNQFHLIEELKSLFKDLLKEITEYLYKTFKTVRKTLDWNQHIALNVFYALVLCIVAPIGLVKIIVLFVYRITVLLVKWFQYKSSTKNRRPLD